VTLVLAFLLLNWVAVFIVSLVTGYLLSFFLLLAAYYGLVRFGVLTMVFPGSNFLMKRQQEFSYAEQFANAMGTALSNAKNSVQSLMMTISAMSNSESNPHPNEVSFYCDAE
jgi:hypothetical protein